MIGPLRIATATFFVTTSGFYGAERPAADPEFSQKKHQPEEGEGGDNLLFGQNLLHENEENWTAGREMGPKFCYEDPPLSHWYHNLNRGEL